MQHPVSAAPNSWVHKQYMSERDFEIEHAADTHYHEVEPHYHEFYELFFFLNGHIDYVVEDQIFEMRRGDLLVIPPSTLHNPIFRDFDVPYERYVLWISAQCMERLSALDPDLDTFRRAARAQAGQAQAGARATLLTAILHYVSDNLCGDLSLETVAQVFYTNKFSISHMFQQDMRISYYQYVIQMRLLAAKKLLLEGMPASKVWDACGFGDYAGFYRAFRKWYGVSPRQFKKLHTSLIAPTE